MPKIVSSQMSFLISNYDLYAVQTKKLVVIQMNSQENDDFGKKKKFYSRDFILQRNAQTRD